jgi:hypothetical protein
MPHRRHRRRGIGWIGDSDRLRWRGGAGRGKQPEQDDENELHDSPA